VEQDPRLLERLPEGGDPEGWGGIQGGPRLLPLREATQQADDLIFPVLRVQRSPGKHPSAGDESGPGTPLKEKDLEAGWPPSEGNQRARRPRGGRRVRRILEGCQETRRKTVWREDR
jgi:hypothetical protein